jgi:peptidoglycan/LPS O-acetylase OafA/YrhL
LLPVTTLGQALDPRRNSINAIRLLFALMVLLGHAIPLGGYAKDMPRLFFHDEIPTYALAGFFVMSGYLIAASRLASRSFGDYMWRRFLRMYPAWIASLLLVGVVLGPLSRIIEGKSGYDWSSGFGYIGYNLFLKLIQLNVTGTLDDVPVVGVWNFSAWTLFYEATLWVGMGLLLTILGRRHLRIGVWAGLAFFTLIKVLDIFVVSYSASNYDANDAVAKKIAEAHASGFDSMVATFEPLARLGIFFMAGAIFYLYRDKIKIAPAAVWACAAVCVGLGVIGWFHVFAALPFAYVVLYFGSSTRLSSVNYPDDYSYGMYIYAFPLTQIMATIALDHPMPVWVFLPLCLLVTMPFAWVSWHFLEKPAMSLKRLTAGRDKPIIGVP